MEKTYDLHPDQAEIIYRELQKVYPDHPAPHFLLALNRWWQSYICHENHFDAFIFAQLDSADRKNLKLADQPAFDLEYTFFQFMIRAFQARLHIRKGSFWPAVKAGRQALPFLKDGFDYAARAPEFYFSSGIYHYYAETYVEDHPIVKPFMIFFPDGDASQGLSELEQAASTANFAQTEAAFHLSDIYLEKERNFPRALDIKKSLHKRYPHNTWFAVDLARAQLANGEIEPARNLLKDLTDRFERLWQPGQPAIDSRQSVFTSLVMVRAYYFAALASEELGLGEELVLFELEKGRRQAGLCGMEKDPLLAEYWFLHARTIYQQGREEEALASLKKVFENDPGDGLKSRARAFRKEIK